MIMSLADYNNIFSKSFTKKMTLTFSEVGETDIVLTNEDICSEEMSLEESLCSDTNLRYGACEASCFKIRVVNSGSFKDKLLTVTMALQGVGSYLIDSDGNNIVDSDGDYISYYDPTDSTTITLGHFKVFSDVPTSDRMYRDLTCYDAMYDILNADVATWYNGLTFPMTIKTLRDSFFTHLGITQETTTLIGDTLSVQGGFTVEETLAGKTVIEAICELNGVFGHINKNGNFEYISLPSTETVTYLWHIDGTSEYEDYITDKVTGITARGEANDVGTSVGTTDNVYVIENNPLVYGLEGSTELTNHLTALLNQIKDFQYRPFKVESYGNPMLPVGTSIVVNTRRYTPSGSESFAINSFVMKKEMSGIQALKDSIESSGDKTIPTNVNGIQSEVTRAKGKIHKITNTVDELSSEIYEIDPQTGTKTSKITQLAGEIVLKVDSNGNLSQVALSADPDTGTTFDIYADKITINANHKLDLSAGTFTISSGNLTVDASGNVSMTGQVNATSGSIGAWNIDQHAIYVNDTTNNYYVILADGTISANHDIFVVRTGTSPNYEYPFYVRGDGTVGATKLEAQGGHIGGWTIGTAQLTYNDGTNVSELKPQGMTMSSSAAGGGSIELYNRGFLRLIQSSPGVKFSFEDGALVIGDSSGSTYKVVIGRFIFNSAYHYGIMCQNGNNRCALIADQGRVYSADGTIRQTPTF